MVKMSQSSPKREKYSKSKALSIDKMPPVWYNIAVNQKQEASPMPVFFTHIEPVMVVKQAKNGERFYNHFHPCP